MNSPAHDIRACKRKIDGFTSWLAATVFTALLAVPADLLAQGCAMCKTAVGGPDDPLARGLNVSILFLMSMPFLLAGSVGGWFFYMYRRSSRQVPALRLVHATKEGTP